MLAWSDFSGDIPASPAVPVLEEVVPAEGALVGVGPEGFEGFRTDFWCPHIL